MGNDQEISARSADARMAPARSLTGADPSEHYFREVEPKRMLDSNESAGDDR